LQSADAIRVADHHHVGCAALAQFGQHLVEFDARVLREFVLALETI